MAVSLVRGRAGVIPFRTTPLPTPDLVALTLIAVALLAALPTPDRDGRTEATLVLEGP